MKQLFQALNNRLCRTVVLEKRKIDEVNSTFHSASGQMYFTKRGPEKWAQRAAFSLDGENKSQRVGLLVWLETIGQGMREQWTV